MAYPSSEDQYWPSYYHNQTPYLESSFTDINSYDHSGVMTTDSVITTSSCDMAVLSPTHSGSPMNGEPSSGASPKPVRRRSRASKKTPTTLLNANKTNFRSLVQQFTGKPKPTSATTPGVHRGPLNINFGKGSYGQEDQGFGSSSNNIPFGSSYDHHGYDTSSQQPFQYEQQSQDYGRLNNYPNSSSGVEISDNFGGDGLNIDDLDWGSMYSSVHPWQ